MKNSVTKRRWVGGATVYFYFNILSKSLESGQEHPDKSHLWKACLAPCAITHSIQPSLVRVGEQAVAHGFISTAHSQACTGDSKVLGCYRLPQRVEGRRNTSLHNSMIQTHLNDLNKYAYTPRWQMWQKSSLRLWEVKKHTTLYDMGFIFPAKATNKHFWVLHSIFCILKA